MSNNNIKLLCVGDQHIQVNNLPEVDLLISSLTKTVDNIHPDFVVFLGDMLHTHEKVFTIALNKALTLIDTIRNLVPVIILVGNHDMVSCAQFMTDEHWLNPLKEWKNVTVIDTATLMNVRGENLVFCPFVPNGRLCEALSMITEIDWKQDVSCIFAHQEITGVKMGAIISSAEEWKESYPFLVSGHIHSKQRPQKNVWYTGSILQIAFGESEKNTISLISIEKGNVKIDEIDLGLPTRKIVYIDVNKAETYDVEKIGEGNQVKLSIEGSYEELKTFSKSNRFKELKSNSQVKVVFKQTCEEKLEEKEQSRISRTQGFSEILRDNVLKNCDQNLYQVYEEVVNGKKGEWILVTRNLKK